MEESVVALDFDDELPALSLLLPLLKVDLVLREASFSLLEVAEKLLTPCKERTKLSIPTANKEKKT